MVRVLARVVKVQFEGGRTDSCCVAVCLSSAPVDLAWAATVVRMLNQQYRSFDTMN